jgi:hypothetical protein
MEEDVNVVFTRFVKTDFANKESSMASRQIYENPCHQYFTIVAYVNGVNVIIIVVIISAVVVIAVIITVVKEVVIALTS